MTQDRVRVHGGHNLAAYEDSEAADRGYVQVVMLVDDENDSVLGISGSPLVVDDPDTQTSLAALLTELGLKASLTETQPVSATSLPLPSDAATQTTLAAVLSDLQAKADRTEDQQITLAGEAVVLAAGTASIGKLGANSGVDIGDVDVTSLPDSNLTAAKFDTSSTDATGLPASYGATHLTLSSVTTMRALHYSFTGDKEITLSFGGANDHYTVLPYSSGSIDLYALGLSVTPEAIKAKAASAPTAGDLALTAIGV